MAKQQWKSKSFSNHIDLDKEEQLKRVKIVVEDQVKHILNLTSEINYGNKERNLRKKSEALELIEDFHKQYEKLYILYENLREKVKKSVDGEDCSSTPDSDTETDYWHGGHDELSNGSPRNSERKFETSDLEDTLTCSSEVTKIMNSEPGSPFGRSSGLGDILRDLEIQREKSGKTNQMLVEIRDLEAQLAAMKIEVSTLRTQKRKLEEQVEWKSNEALQKQEKISTLEDQIVEIEAASNEQERLFSTFAKQFKDDKEIQNSRIADLEAQAEGLLIELNNLTHQKNELEVGLFEESKHWSSKVEGLMEQVSSLQQQLETANSYNEELKLEMKKKSEEISEHLLQLEARRNELRLSEQQTADEKESLQVKVHNLESEIESLKSTKSELEDQVQKMNDEASQSSTEREKLEEKVSELQTTVATRENELTAEQNKFTDYQTEMSMKMKSLEEAVESLTNKLETCENERSCLQAEIESLKSTKSELEDQVQKMNDEASQSSTEREKLEEKVSELQTTVATRENELTAEQNKFTDYQTEMSVKMKSLEEAVESLTNKLETYENERSCLQAELEASQNDKNLLQLELEKEKEQSKSQKEKITKTNFLQVERKIEEMAVEFRKQFEDQYRILSRRIRVAEQLQAENKEWYRKTRDSYKQDNKDLKKMTAQNATELKNVKNLSITANELLTMIDSKALKLEEHTANFQKKISRVSCGISSAKLWAMRKNKAISEMKKDIDCLLIQLDDKEAEILTSREKVGELENKVRELKKVMEEKEDEMLVLTEEKMEAIRQLCIWIDYHRGQKDFYKNLVSDMNTGRRRAS